MWLKLLSIFPAIAELAKMFNTWRTQKREETLVENARDAGIIENVATSMQISQINELEALKAKNQQNEIKDKFQRD